MRVWYECLSICSEYRNSHLNFTKQALTLSDLFPFYILRSEFYALHFTFHILHVNLLKCDLKMNIKFFLVVGRDNNNNLTVLYCFLINKNLIFKHYVLIKLSLFDFIFQPSLHWSCGHISPFPCGSVTLFHHIFIGK